MGDKEELNSGHYFELLDRTHVATNYLESSIGEHPVLEHEQHLREIYDEIHDKMDLLYQEIGAINKTWGPL